jgi:hypothetical protein
LPEAKNMSCVSPPPVVESLILARTVEAGCFLFAVFLARHAYLQGTRWLSTLLTGVFVGGLTEWLILLNQDLTKTHYVYSHLFLHIGHSDRVLPIWIAVGWGCILYAATWAAQRLDTSVWLRPFVAGLLAVNIDLSLDPVANITHFWVWTSCEPSDYYGVPFDNFLGWFTIVATYALFVLRFFRWFDRWTKHKARDQHGNYHSRPHRGDAYIPPAAGVCASGVLYLVRKYAPVVYGWVPVQYAFALVLLFAFIIVIYAAVESRRSKAINAPIVALPVVFHASCALLLLCANWNQNPYIPTLLVAVPSHLVLGVFGYSWPSLDSIVMLLRRRHRQLLKWMKVTPDPVLPPVEEPAE